MIMVLVRLQRGEWAFEDNVDVKDVDAYISNMKVLHPSLFKEGLIITVDGKEVDSSKSIK
jgi:hypothetical protein